MLLIQPLYSGKLCSFEKNLSTMAIPVSIYLGACVNGKNPGIENSILG